MYFQSISVTANTIINNLNFSAKIGRFVLNFQIYFMLAPFFNQDNQEVGCDEAGRGCLSGPVVAAAVVLNFKPHPWVG